MESFELQELTVLLNNSGKKESLGLYALIPQ